MKALWNVLAEHGGENALLSYRNTWPPGPDMHWALTHPALDFAAYWRFDLWGGVHPGILDALNHSRPEGLISTLGLFPFTGERVPLWSPLASDRTAMEGLLLLDRMRDLDGRQKRATKTRGKRGRNYDRRSRRGRTTPALTMILLHGPDRAAHLNWRTIQQLPSDPVSRSRVLELAEQWDGPYVGGAPFSWGTAVSQILEIDRWLRKPLRAVRYDYVVLVSDHGMTTNPPGTFPPGAHARLNPDAHVGIFSVTGPGVASRVDLGTISVLDVAPTVAYLLGLPVAENLPGRLLTDAFSRKRLRCNPIETVPTWE